MDKAQSKAMSEEGLELLGNEGRPEYAALQGAVPKIVMDSGRVTAGSVSYRIMDHLIHSSSPRHMLCVWKKLRCLFESLYWYFLGLVFIDEGSNIQAHKFLSRHVSEYKLSQILKAIRECIFCISSPGGWGSNLYNLKN